MAHAGTTLDLGRSRQTTKEKRSGWFKAPLMVALAVMLGIAVGTAAWAVARSQTATSTHNAANVAAVHEKIEAHQALVATQVDRSTDAIETHRIAVANAAIVRAYPVYDPIKQHELAYGTEATVAPVYPVYDPIKQHELAYGTEATVAPVYPVYDPIKQHELAYGTEAAGAVVHGRDFDPALPSAAGVADHRFDAIESHRIAAANAAMNTFAGSLDQIETKRTQIANAGTGPFTSTLDLSVRRGYDDPLIITGQRLPLIVPAVPLVDNLSIRRGYDQMPAVSSTVGRAYSQGIALQPAPTMDSSGRIGRAYSQGIATQVIVPLSAVDGAAPTDTPWGPRPAR